MELGKELVGAMLIFSLFLLIAPANASLNNYFSYRMNFYSQQLHVQTINFSGNLSVTIPANFTIYNYTGAATNNSGVINWSTANATVNYTLRGPASCAEGTRYFSNISVDGAFVDKFTFVCMPDEKIVDYKAEYGHGDANYLSEDFIPNDTTTIFNLIRVFNIGNFLEPNEDAYNATINCTFPDFPVRTYGRVEVTRSNNQINGGFFWEMIEGGYWFRVGVLSQDFSSKPVGYTYNISCNSLTYSFSKHQVVASFTNKTLEIRSKNPFNITVTDNGNYLTYTIKNTEKYSTKNVVFKWSINNLTKTEELNSMNPNDMIKFDVFLEGSGTINFEADFVPSWFANSRNPSIVTQARSDAYNFNTRSPRIVDLGVTILRAVNQTTTDTRISQQRNFRAELSDFGKLIGGQVYRVRLLVFDFEGKPINASSTRLIIYDPLRSVIVNTTMSQEGVGIYIYSYTTSSSQTSGIYETIAEVNVSDVVIKLNDFWALETSPTQVRINSIVDNTIPTITGDVIIENEGSADAEYQYEYCIVANEDNQCGGNDDVDFASAAKLVKKGEQFNPLLTLNVPSTGEYYFKVIVYFGTQFSGATKKFTAVEAPVITAAANVTAGGAKLFDVDLSVSIRYFIKLKEGDIKTLTFDRYTTHIIVAEVVSNNSISLTVRSVPITLSLSRGMAKNVDINRDGFDDIKITLNSIVNYEADVTIERLSGALLIPKRGCLEDWFCTDWSQCYPDSRQVRDCIDRSECNTIYDKPVETKSCAYTPTTVSFDISGIADYLSSTQGEIKLFGYIVLAAFILSTAMFILSLYKKPKLRGYKKLYKILGPEIDPKLIKSTKHLELVEEKLEKKIAMLDHAYNRGTIDEKTRNAVKIRLQKRLKKIRRRIAELKMMSI